jgi:polysaccharide export outer membrane protein
VRNETESPYIIEPPDILLITPIRLVPRDAVRIQPGDKVIIDVEGAPYTEPIKGQFKVDSSGEVVLGPRYGSVKISGLKRREAQEAVKTQLQTVLKSPEVALTIDESRIEKGIDGQHLVGPDGTINLGTYGQVQVDHDTVQQATKAIEDKLKGFFLQAEVAIDIYAYNSKVFYVIVDGRAGSTIYRFPITGNETLLDAVAQVPGLTGLSESTIFIARPVPKAIDRSIPVNWNDALSGTKPGANPPILAGDRIFIQGAFREPGLGSGGSYKAPAWPPGEKPQNSHVISTPSPPNQ